MKFINSVLISATAAISCYTCREESYADCFANKVLVQCQLNEEVCQLHVRRRNGAIEKVRMGCKQHLACDNNMQRNFVDSDEVKQCQPSAESAKSVCRQCCDQSDDCALQLAALNSGQGPLTEAEWIADLTDHELPVTSDDGEDVDGRLLPSQEPGLVHWNDSRYPSQGGTLTEYIRSLRDSRYDPNDPRHNDDYYNP